MFESAVVMLLSRLSRGVGAKYKAVIVHSICLCLIVEYKLATQTASIVSIHHLDTWK